MRVKFKGEDLGEWTGQPTLREARKLKRELQMLPGEFGQALTNKDPDAMSWLIALLLSRKLGESEEVYWEDVDGDYADVEIELTPDEQKRLDEFLSAMEAEMGKLPPQLSNVNVADVRRSLNGAKPAKRATSKTSKPPSRKTGRATGGSTASR